jgi:hypothetical protein
VSSRSKASVRRSSSWALVSRDGVQGMWDSTISCQTENTGVNIQTQALITYKAIVQEIGKNVAFIYFWQKDIVLLSMKLKLK